MGVTKTDIYTDSQNQLAAIAKVLGHPARIAILEFIIKQPSCICGDLVEEIGLAQATISQHLKELKNSGIIQGTIEGTSICYCINQNNWKKTSNLLNNFMNIRLASNDSCC